MVGEQFTSGGGDGASSGDSGPAAGSDAFNDAVQDAVSDIDSGGDGGGGGDAREELERRDRGSGGGGGGDAREELERRDRGSGGGGGASAPDARAERVADSIERDPRRVLAGTERIPLGVEPTGEDITFDRTGDPQFTDEFRGELQDAQFRDMEARFAATTPGVSGPETTLERTDSGVRPTDEALAGMATARAADDDPLRDEDEFVATVEGEGDDRDVEVRRRADPFFAEQREAFGEATGLPGLPGLPGEPLTTDAGESTIRRGLQRGDELFGTFASGESVAATGNIGADGFESGAVDDAAAQSEGFGFIRDFSTSTQNTGEAVFNLPGAALGAANIGEAAADLGQAEAETRADVFASGFADTDAPGAIDPVNDPTGGLEVFDFEAPEGSAAAEEREATGEAVTQAAEQTAEIARERPGVIAGAVAGGALAGGALSVGTGLGGRAALVGTRGRLATRGTRGDVDFEAIERPDVRSGQSRLTRFSEDAVPGGKRSMAPEDFPVEPSRSPQTELQRLADRFETPEIRDRLDAGPDESTLFSARGGRKPESFELRSGRPYDPDAAFFAGSVSRNFLDVGPGTSGGVGLRLPRPLSGARSLRDAAGGDTPSIIATAGRVDELPDDVRTRGEITEFLGEEANSGRFFTRQRDNQSGEAEAVTAAEGAESKTNPWEGAGQIEPGDATEFVEVARPMRTEVRGEGVPIQFTRQQTGDVTPRSQQGLFGDFLGDERGMVGARRGRGEGDSTVRVGREFESRPYTPGGAPGTPLGPVFPGGASSPGATPDSDFESSVFGSGFDVSAAGSGTPGAAGGAPSVTASPSGSDAPGSPGDGGGPGSPFEGGGPGSPTSPFIPGSPTENPVTPPSDTPFTPFDPPGGGGRGRRRDGPETNTDPDPAPLFGTDVLPETPEFGNPIASGVEDVFGY